MAAKPVAAGSKRKASSSANKGKSDSKKARVDETKTRKSAPASKGDDSDPDLEEGGVQLSGKDAKNVKKGDAGANADGFDR
ncbi:hypothetical protein E4U54_004180, partial [Claviceps lovelessii]